MEQSKDYLEREIEKLGLVLAGLIEKISSLSPNQANDEIDEVNQALKEEFDFNISELITMEDSDFISHISKLHDSHIEHLAQLLYHLSKKSQLLKLEKAEIAEKAIVMLDELDENLTSFLWNG